MPKNALAISEPVFVSTFQTKYPLTMVGGEFPNHLGVRLPRNWPLKKLFYQTYTELMDNGQVNNLKIKYSFKEEHTKLAMNSNHPLSMMEFFTLFVFWGILATTALIIAFWECGFHKNLSNAPIVH